MNIAVFASHGGSNLQALVHGCKNNQINALVVVVISNNGDSMALQRAKDEGIPGYHLSAKNRKRGYISREDSRGYYRNIMLK